MNNKDTEDTEETKKNGVSLYDKVLESINGLWGVIDDFNGESYEFVDCHNCTECDLFAFCGQRKYYSNSGAVQCDDIPMCRSMNGVWKRVDKDDGYGMDVYNANKDAQADSDKDLDDETMYEVQFWSDVDKCWMMDV